jgi:hypothetical protein
MAKELPVKRYLEISSRVLASTAVSVLLERAPRSLFQMQTNTCTWEISRHVKAFNERGRMKTREPIAILHLARTYAMV